VTRNINEINEAQCKPLRILHLASSERWTGAAEPLTSLALQQMRQGHQVWIGCVPGDTFEEKAKAAGTHVVTLFHLNRRLHPLHMLSDLCALPRFCRENQVDIVHCHLIHDHWLAALSLWPTRHCHSGRPLLIRTRHGSREPHTDWFHRQLVNRLTDRVVCVSRHVAQLTETAFRMPAGAVSNVAGGVNLDRFHPDLDRTAIRKELGIPLDAPVAGIVARVRAGRGVRWLMRSVPLLLEKIPNAHVVIFGRGELKKWFRGEIENPRYRGQVHNGLYRQDDLPLAYAACDVTLFLGMGSEGTCRAILEAMACGRPTIGANLGPIAEIIVNGETGLLVQPNSEEDLANKLAALLSDHERCARMGQTARERAETHYTEEARAEAFMRIYAEMLQPKSRS
jgi:glycosyltransferase involved in cell wall biosynthesis